MPFTNLLVAVDGSEASNRALSKALELAALTGAVVTALAVEGPLPAYAATVGEVDEVKREKDAFFGRLARDVRAEAERAGVPMEVDVLSGADREVGGTIGGGRDLTCGSEERVEDLAVRGKGALRPRSGRLQGSSRDRNSR